MTMYHCRVRSDASTALFLSDRYDTAVCWQVPALDIEGCAIDSEIWLSTMLPTVEEDKMGIDRRPAQKAWLSPRQK